VRRGDLVTVALQGEQGKPRPALVVQADHFAGLSSVTVLPLTGTLIEAPLLRIAVEPSPENGLARRSQVMVDKPQTPPRGKLGPVRSAVPWQCSSAWPDPCLETWPLLPTVGRLDRPRRSVRGP